MSKRGLRLMRQRVGIRDRIELGPLFLSNESRIWEDAFLKFMELEYEDFVQYIEEIDVDSETKKELKKQFLKKD